VSFHWQTAHRRLRASCPSWPNFAQITASSIKKQYTKFPPSLSTRKTGVLFLPEWQDIDLLEF
jgi:hypothetical protein